MMSMARTWSSLAGGLILAATAGGSVRAQEYSAIPALPEAPAAIAAPTSSVPIGGGVDLERLPSPVAGLPHHPGGDPRAVPLAPPDRSDRETRRLWRRFQRQEKCLGYPEEFAPKPLGASVYTNNRIQVANGEAAQMVFYDYDFVVGKSELNLQGHDRLSQIMQRLPVTFFPVIVERTPSTPGLDEARRLAILSQFASSAFPIPSERVVVGRPIARGLSGAEAERVYTHMLDRTRDGGPPVSSGGSFLSGGGAGAATGR